MARETRLSPRILSTIELGHFEALPSGVFARAHLAAYAKAVGLDCQEVVERLADRLPPIADPLEALRQREKQRWMEEHPVLAVLAETAQRVSGALSARSRLAARTLIEAGGNRWRQRSSGLLDGLMLLLVSGAILGGAAAMTGTSVHALVRTRFAPLVVCLTLMMLHYLVVTRGVIGRRTQGCSPAPARSRSSARLFRRAWPLGLPLEGGLWWRLRSWWASWRVDPSASRH